MNYALISPPENNRICMVANTKFKVALPLFWVLCADEITPEWTYLNGTFVAPLIEPVVPTVPNEVSMFQAEEALAELGYLDDVEELMAHPDTPEKYKRAWRRATTVRRDAEVVAAMAALLPLSEAQLDELFTFASNVTA